jgi:NDP-sugar pyrophosphorylase family protein
MALIGSYMNLIMTMAGQYQRFAREGYKIPKYLLPWGDRTILSVILNELNKEKIFQNIILVANQRDEAFLPHVYDVMLRQKVPKENLLVTHDTSGQVETARLGVNALRKIQNAQETPILVHNIDTILRNRNLLDISNLLDHNAGFIDVFSANNHDYSYVLLDEGRRVTDIAEKIVISNLATSGLYGFNSIETFDKFASSDDIYISSIYRRMVSCGVRVVTGIEHKEQETIVLGTPLEYMNASSVFLINNQ